MAIQPVPFVAKYYHTKPIKDIHIGTLQELIKHLSIGTPVFVGAFRGPSTVAARRPAINLVPKVLNPNCKPRHFTVGSDYAYYMQKGLCRYYVDDAFWSTDPKEMISFYNNRVKGHVNWIKSTAEHTYALFNSYILSPDFKI